MKIQSWLLATSLLLFFGCSQQEEAPAAGPSPTQGPRSTLIDGFITSPQRLEQIINATGNLIAYESVEIRPERSGKLVSLDFRESSYIQKNTVIGQVDDAELIAQKERLTVNLELAEKEVARGRELLAIEGISQEELDRLINTVADIKAEQNILDIQISKSKIRAPFSGVIGLRQVSQGAYITPNDIIVDLKQISPIKLEFEVPERYLTQVREGQTLGFTIVGSDRIFTARVYAIDTEISPLTRTFKVRASAQNPDNILKPGQFAKVSLVTGTKNDAILVPTDAVIPVLDGKQVYMVRKGRVIAQRVITNDRSSDMVEIVEGLTIGDTVAVGGLLALSDGVAIRINELRQDSIPTTE